MTIMADNVVTANANSAALFKIILDGACEFIPCRYSKRVLAWEHIKVEIQDYQTHAENLNTQLNDEIKMLRVQNDVLQKNLKATQDHINYNLVLAGQQFSGLQQMVGEKVKALENGIARLQVVASEFKDVLDSGLEKLDVYERECGSTNVGDAAGEGEFLGFYGKVKNE